MKRLIGLTVAGLLVISIFSSFGFANAQVTLKDISGHLFEFEIRKLVEAGIVKGFPDATFRPEGLVTRADISIMIALAKKLPLVRPAVSPFRDVPTTHYAYGHIVAARNAGYLRGYPDGTFRPAANVNRSEKAAILGQAKGLAAEAAKITVPIAFAQDEAAIPKWAMGWVTLGYRPEHQYLSHRSVAGFRLIAPLAPATRAEVAYGIYHIMNPPREGGTISTATWQEPDTLHHYITTMLSAWSLLGMVDLPSTHRDENWALFPGSLREIPTVENGLWKVVGNAMEITFRQRPGLKFHDGKPATLDDWAYNFMVFMDEMTPVVARVIERKIDFERGTGAHGIRGFDFLAPDVVRVYFKELDWRANLGLPGLGIYPRHVTEPVYKRMKEIGGTAGVDHFRINEVMARKPIGMGPYKIVEWRPGSFISLERFDDYILGKPLVRRIIHRFIPDTTAFLARVIAGKDVHITCQVGLTFTQGMSLEKRRPAHLKLHFARSLTWEHIGVNLENPDNPMIDLRVRKAFIHAINRREMVERLFRGRQPVAHSYLPPEHWGYDDAAPIKYEHNLELARKLLDEAGWRLGPDGWRYKAGRRLTLELRTTIDPVMRQPVQAVLKAQLKKVGIDLDITRNMPAGVLFARDHFYGRRWPHLIMFAWSMSPTSMGDTIFRGDMIPSPEVGWEGQNVYFWKNDEATELLKKAPNLMSEVERRKALFRVQRLLSEELPVIPLYFRSTVMAHHANIATVRPGLRVLWNPYYWYWR